MFGSDDCRQVLQIALGGFSFGVTVVISMVLIRDLFKSRDLRKRMIAEGARFEESARQWADLMKARTEGWFMQDLWCDGIGAWDGHEWRAFTRDPIEPPFMRPCPEHRAPGEPWARL